MLNAKTRSDDGRTASATPEFILVQVIQGILYTEIHSGIAEAYAK